jgi:peptidoglycan-associated lipoprotein
MTLKRFSLSLILAASAALLAACGSSVKLDENGDKGAPVENRAGTGASSTAGSGSAGANQQSARQVTQVDLAAKDPLNDPNSPLAKRSIYFDFDSFTIRDDFRGVVEAHARYLNANKNRKVVIQGNTDERGSREYNLALGQKRSEAVRKALVALGVADGQLEAVSFGEEKPKATGSDEAAWAENRRADLAYQ